MRFTKANKYLYHNILGAGQSAIFPNVQVYTG